MYVMTSIMFLASFSGFWYYKKYRFARSFSGESERVNNMTVALAFAISCCDGQMSDEKIHIIQSWIHKHIPESNQGRKFHKAITTTKAFFTAGNKIDVHGICREINATAELNQRYGIIELCMKIAAADGIAKAQELAFLKNLAERLELDRVKVCTMMENFVPVNIHEVKDAEFVLGINGDMSAEQAREKLSREYKKWNGRATNPDLSIRRQAKVMIELISSLRSKYLGQNSTSQIA